MREILFRAKSVCADNPSDVSEDYWVEGSLVQKSDKYGERTGICYIVKPGSFEKVLPETVTQFTGLFDKHGNKIFEGDIVSNDVFRACVEFNDGRFIPFNGDHGIFYPDECKVVGNVYDNPEILWKEGKTSDDL